MTEFLAMGGYGGYVWSAYAVFFIVLLADALTPLLRNRQMRKDLHGRYLREHMRRNKS